MHYFISDGKLNIIKTMTPYPFDSASTVMVVEVDGHSRHYRYLHVSWVKTVAIPMNKFMKLRYADFLKKV